MTKLINIPAEIRKYWWEKSENLINVPGTTISDSRVGGQKSLKIANVICEWSLR